MRERAHTEVLGSTPARVALPPLERPTDFQLVCALVCRTEKAAQENQIFLLPGLVN